MKINEIFYSIQGESLTIGQPAIFVRFSKCNLNCTFCFGFRNNNGAVPRVSLLNGNGQTTRKRIDKVIEGDVLLTYDKNQNIVETTVINTIKRQVTKWIKIKIDGRNYLVTPEHPFFTTIGLLKAEDLKVGDYIYEMSGNKRSSYRMKKNNPMFNEEIKERSVKNTDYKKLGKNMSKRIKKQKEEGTYIPVWNLMSKEAQDILRKKAADRQMGNKNTNWSGGSEYPVWEMLKEKNRTKQIGHIFCSICKQEKILEVHHLDENHNNDTEKNMISICHKCHSQIHERGYNFWNGKRIDNKENLEAAMNNNGKKVEDIKIFDIEDKKQYPFPSTTPKLLDVYNITCAPYDTYIVDNMWVHNCDSKYHTHVDENLNEQSILDLIKENPQCNRIIFTGGEPFLQQNRICNFLIDNWFLLRNMNIEFETNGAVIIKNQLKILIEEEIFHFHFNVSPKFNSSGNDELTCIYHQFKDITYPHTIIFKFVYISEYAFEILDFINAHSISKEMIYIMPEGETKEKQEKLMPEVIDFCKEYGFNFTPRIQVLVWNTKKGV